MAATKKFLSNPQALQEIENNFRNADIKQINDVMLPNGDKLPFDIKAYSARVGAGNDVAVIKVQIRNAPTLKLADSKQIKIQDKNQNYCIWHLLGKRLTTSSLLFHILEGSLLKLD